MVSQACWSCAAFSLRWPLDLEDEELEGEGEFAFESCHRKDFSEDFPQLDAAIIFPFQE